MACTFCYREHSRQTEASKRERRAMQTVGRVGKLNTMGSYLGKYLSKGLVGTEVRVW